MDDRLTIENTGATSTDTTPPPADSFRDWQPFRNSRAQRAVYRRRRPTIRHRRSTCGKHAYQHTEPGCAGCEWFCVQQRLQLRLKFRRDLSANPRDVPHRANLMACQHRQFERRDPMPEAFGSAGYTTFGTGKWHNDSTSFVRSFDQGEHIFFGGCTGCSNTSHTDNDTAKAVVFNTTVQNMNPNGTFTTVTPGQHGSTHNSTLFADATVDFIATHTATSNDPFFAYLSFTAPHDPRVSPEPYDSMYRDTGENSTVPLPVDHSTRCWLLFPSRQRSVC